MKRRIDLPRALLALSFPVSVVPQGVRAQATVTVTVISTTDVHGRVMHWDYVNDRLAPLGLSRVATAVDSIRAVANGPVVVVDGGDLIQGNAFATFFAENPRNPHPIMDALNAIGYDAATPGNHEFDFGVETLLAAHGQAEFPVVSGNIYDGVDGLAYEEYVILERQGVRIGVTGFTTPGVMVWDGAVVRGLREVRRIIPEATRVVANLEREEADLKIVVIHSGMDGASSYDTTGVGPENVAAQLASLPTPPDLVIVGHSHGVMVDSVIRGVHFMQPRPWALSMAVAKVTLVLEGSRYRIQSITGEQVDLENVAPDRGFARRIESPHADVRTWLNAPVAEARGEWSGQFARAGDSPLIDFVNEVQRRRAGADLSATAAFETAVSIPAGSVRRRDVMGVYPFENTLKAVRITGAGLRQYLERSAEYFNRHPANGPVLNDAVWGTNFDIVSGVEYNIDISRPVGGRIMGLAFQGRPVTDDQTFTLALNNFRQAGGGNFAMLAGLPVVYDRGENIRDLLIDEIQRVGRLDSSQYFNPSWRIVPEAAARAVAVEFGARPEILVDRVIAKVLSLTDFFGALEPVITPWSEARPVGGVAALTRVMDSLESGCRCAGIRVATGDQLRGTLLADGEFGRSVVASMSAAAVDAAVPGPADFAWGLDTLAARIAESNFPWLGANVVLRNGGLRPEYLRAWTVVEEAGVRVAVIGVVWDSLPGSGRAARVPDAITVTDPVRAIEAALTEIGQMPLDAVVLAAHLPAFCDESGCQGALIELIKALPPDRIDLVVGGHSDTEASAIVNGIPLVLPGSYGLTVGATDLIDGADGARRAETGIVTAWAEAGTPVVPANAETVGGIDNVTTVMRFPATHEPGGQSPYGNLLADAYRNGARAQIAMVWNGDIGPGFGADTLTPRIIYRLQPARFGLVRVRLRGDQLFEVLEVALRDGVPSVHLSGIHVTYDPGRRAGDRVRRVEFPNGDRLRENQEYTIALSDQVARGAFGFTVLAGVAGEPADLSDFEALVRYLGRLRAPVEAPADQRFIVN